MEKSKESINDILTKERGIDNEMFTNTWLQWVGFITFIVITIFAKDSQNISFLTALLVIFFIPFKPYQKELKFQIERLVKFLSELITGGVTLIVVLVVGAIVLWGGWKVIIMVADFITPNEWTLMVCEDKLNYAECLDNSYVISGFKSQKDCMLEGASKFDKQGFECGSNCKNENGLKICKEVCNKAGCRG